MPVSSVLYNLRKQRGLTQTELSEALGKRIAQTTLGQYELGLRTPSMKNMKLLAEFYGVPVSYLYADPDMSDEEIAFTMVDMMHQDEAYRTLFDASRKLSPEDLRPINAILQSIAKGRNPDE